MFSITQVKKSKATQLCLVVLISLAACVLVYWPGLFGPFLLDDLPSIKPAQLDVFSWSKLLEISTQNESGPIGRPLSILSFALNHLFFGPEPLSYKLVNLILHFLTGIGLAWLTFLLLSAPNLNTRYKHIIAGLVAFVWLIHPLQVSTVLYAVQRMTILTQLFTVLACGLYVKARLKQLSHQRSTILFSLAGFCWILGLLAKETAILLPLYLYIIEYFILRFKLSTDSASASFSRYATLFVVLGGLTVISLFLYKLDSFMAIFSEKPYSLVERLLTQINALSFYIRMIYLPLLSKMGLYHDDFPIAQSFSFLLIANSIFLSGLIASTLLLKKRAPLISFGIAWFFVSHLLESTILPLELVFEHRNYLSCYGLILVPILVIAHVMQKPVSPLQRAYPVLGGLFIILLMSMTWTRSISWSSTERFLHAALINKPNSARTHIEFANWLMTKEAYQLAFTELLTAQKLQPMNTGIDLHILLLHCQAAYLPDAIYQNVDDKLQKYPITPYVILGLDKLVQNLFQNQCQNIPKEKVTHLIHTAYKNPYLKHRPRYKAVLYHLEAGILLLNDKPGDAKMLLMRSFETYPRRMDPLVAKATLELNEGDLKSAKESINLLQKYKMKPYAPRLDIEKLKQRAEHYDKTLTH